MPIYRGSTQVYNWRTNSEGFKYLTIINKGGGKIFQPGNGRLYTNCYPRSNIKQGSISAYGYEAGMKYYRAGVGSMYDFGVGTSTNYKWPTANTTYSNTFNGTNVYSTSYLSQNTSITIGGSSKACYGWKIKANSPNCVVRAYVYIFNISGYATLPSAVYMYSHTGTDGGTSYSHGLTAVPGQSGLYFREFTLAKTAVDRYISLPVIYDTKSYSSGQIMGVQSYISFATA